MGAKPLRIAMITSSFPRFQGDGAGSFVYSLALHLIRLGHIVTVLAPDDPEVDPAWQSDVPVKWVRTAWPRSLSRLGHARSLAGDLRIRWRAYPLVMLFSFFAAFRLCVEVRRRRVDIIYAHWLLPGGFVGALVRQVTRVALVVSVHGSDVFVAERYRLLRRVARSTLRSACQVIACSGDLAQRVVNLGMPEGRVKAIPYGVDVDRFRPAPTGIEAIRAELSIPAGRQVVMAMGRLVDKKGFPYLLRALALVLRECPETFLVIAGAGGSRTELERLAVSIEVDQHVLFTGHVPWHRTPAVLAAADVLVVPSIIDEAGNVDGLPNVLLESMACGCAIVASRVGGIPDVILDGKNGLLVQQKDERALARALTKLLRDPALRSRLGQAARSDAAAGLTWDHAARQVACVLESCTREGS